MLTAITYALWWQFSGPPCPPGGGIPEAKLRLQEPDKRHFLRLVGSYEHYHRVERYVRPLRTSSAADPENIVTVY